MPSYSDANMHFVKTEYIHKLKRARKKGNFYFSTYLFTYLFIYLCTTVFLTNYFQVLRHIISEVGRRDEMTQKYFVDMFVWLSSPSRQYFFLLELFG